MIDVIAAITLTGLAIGTTGILILSSPLGGAQARRLALSAAAWFVVLAALAAAGIFSNASRVGTPAIGAAVLAPVIAVALSTHLALFARLAVDRDARTGRP
jgi:hypothetical protein